MLLFVFINCNSFLKWKELLDFVIQIKFMNIKLERLQSEVYG